MIDAGPMWFYNGIPNSSAAALPSIRSGNDNRKDKPAPSHQPIKYFIWGISEKQEDVPQIIDSGAEWMNNEAKTERETGGIQQ